VRYLRVLISSVDCRVLLERITGQIDYWLSKNLSYAGRLQLLPSVLYSMQIYWTCIFIFPKKVIKSNEQKFNKFLWNGKDVEAVKTKVVKVAWIDVCFPKEGGLGLKSLGVWNQTSMLRHI
jgi:hypothetical protein